MAGLGAVGKCARILTAPFPVGGGADAPRGAVCREVSEDWFSRRYMDPTVLEGLCERERATTPDPTDEQMKRAGARIVAPSGLDEGTMAT